VGEVTDPHAPDLSQIRAPEPLTPEHDLGPFVCSTHPELARWLQQRALKNEGRASRTYVLAAEHSGGRRVVGFYCLSTGSVAVALAPGSVKRNMPDPIPVLVLGRLALDDAIRGQGYGKALLQDALLRCLQVSDLVGIRAVILHAKDDAAASFYRKYGFIESPTEPRTFFLPIETIAAVFKP
jgi:GNAT superfamily N-acetyltransferase